MALGLENTISFGKWKGKTVGVVLAEDPGYLLWLRDEKKKDTGDEKFFSNRVLLELNKALREDSLNRSKKFRGKYQVWKIDGDIEPETKEEILAAMKMEREALEEAERNASIYDGRWGAY